MRRLTEEYDSPAIVIVSQILLIALSLAWGIYLITIAMNGGVLSVENNPWVYSGRFSPPS